MLRTAGCSMTASRSASSARRNSGRRISRASTGSWKYAVLVQDALANVGKYAGELIGGAARHGEHVRAAQHSPKPVHDVHAKPCAARQQATKRRAGWRPHTRCPCVMAMREIAAVSMVFAHAECVRKGGKGEVGERTWSMDMQIRVFRRMAVGQHVRQCARQTSPHQSCPGSRPPKTLARSPVFSASLQKPIHRPIVPSVATKTRPE